MAAHSANGYVDRGGAGQCGSAGDSNLAGWVPVSIVEGNRHIGSTETLIKIISKHCPRTVNGFLRWLPNENNRPAPLLFQCGKSAARADQRGHVNIMSASVHHADFFARRVPYP